MYPKLHETLTATRECGQRLLDVLQEEDLALRSAEADDIDRITAAKQALILEIESLQQAQDNFLAANNLPSGPQSVERYIKTLPADAPERVAWSDLQALVSQCRIRNEINGSILALSRNHVRQALEILKGSPETGTIYDRNGEALPASGTNPLAKA